MIKSNKITLEIWGKKVFLYLFSCFSMYIRHMLCAVPSRSILFHSVTPGTVACQAPLAMGFSGQEYWSGLPCPLPGDLPDPWIKPRSSTLQVDSLPSEPLGKPMVWTISSSWDLPDSVIELGSPALQPDSIYWNQYVCSYNKQWTTL